MEPTFEKEFLFNGKTYKVVKDPQVGWVYSVDNMPAFLLNAPTSHAEGFMDVITGYAEEDDICQEMTSVNIKGIPQKYLRTTSNAGSSWTPWMTNYNETSNSSNDTQLDLSFIEVIEKKPVFVCDAEMGLDHKCVVSRNSGIHVQKNNFIFESVAEDKLEPTIKDKPMWFINNGYTNEQPDSTLLSGTWDTVNLGKTIVSAPDTLTNLSSKMCKLVTPGNGAKSSVWVHGVANSSNVWVTSSIIVMCDTASSFYLKNGSQQPPVLVNLDEGSIDTQNQLKTLSSIELIKTIDNQRIYQITLTQRCLLTDTKIGLYIELCDKVGGYPTHTSQLFVMQPHIKFGQTVCPYCPTTNNALTVEPTYVYTKNVDWLDKKQFSIHAQIPPLSNLTISDKLRYLFNLTGDTPDTLSVAMRISASDALILENKSNTVMVSSKTITEFDPTITNKITLTVRDQQVNLYINAVLVLTTTINLSNEPEHFVVGGYDIIGDGKQFDDYIEQLVIYPECLSANQVQTLEFI